MCFMKIGRSIICGLFVLLMVCVVPVAAGGGGPPCGEIPQVTGNCGSIHLSWTNAPVDHYNVYRGTIMGGPYVYIGPTTVAAYDDTNVFVGTTYYYVVRPADASNGEYCQSNEGLAMPSNCIPEFPSTLLPSTMIIGFLGTVLLIQRTRE
jgi:hypothetical protein